LRTTGLDRLWGPPSPQPSVRCVPGTVSPG